MAKKTCNTNTSTPPPSSDIRSRINLSQPDERPANFTNNAVPSNEAFSSLTVVLELLTRQQQDSAKVNSAVLEAILAGKTMLPRRPRLADVYIAPYDPDGDVPVRDWCEHVDRIKEHWGLTDYEVCTKIASLLLGQAKVLGDP